MTYLLDTHVWLWSVTDPSRLTEVERELIEAGTEELALSAISVWEAMMLHESGRFDLGSDPARGIEFAMREYPITEMPITREIAIRSRLIDLRHRDPADRFIAATAVEHRQVVVTHDRVLRSARGVHTLET